MSRHRRITEAVKDACLFIAFSAVAGAVVASIYRALEALSNIDTFSRW